MIGSGPAIRSSAGLRGHSAAWLAHAAAPDANAQLWSEVDGIVQIAKRVDVTGSANARAAEGFPTPALVAASLAVDLTIHGTVLTAGDLEARTRSASGASTNVHLPLISASFFVPMGSALLSDRNRVERIDGVPGSPIRYRNRLAAELPIPRGRAWTAVELSDEVFYDDSRHRWTRNRAQIPTVWKVGGQSELLVYLLDQHDSIASPHNLHVLGLTLRIKV
jgi:hypothetical protein